ncbi:protein FAR1-RELATED SEQUENCE 5-like [Fagus crenata]
MDFSKNVLHAVGDNDKRENNENVTLGECDEIKLGIHVSSEEEAYNLYNRYALKKGFSIRKGVRRMINGVIRQREYLCSKEGFKEFEDPFNPKKLNHLDTRTGCCARIQFDVKNDIWSVLHFNDTHNYEFASPDEKCNLRSGRKVLSTHGSIISTMVSSGIKATKSYSYLSKEVGGTNNVGFTKRDVHNYLGTTKKEMIEVGDGQSVINHFKNKQIKNLMFFYSVQVDQNNRMTNFFWRDGRSKIDYDSFGDVVILTLMSLNNKRYFKNVLFGCAFLIDETIESFIWLFETFFAAMGGRQPKSIFTDQNQAMTNAIKVVFSESRYRLCLWHINFYAKFNKCLNGCMTIMEFESTWREMIEKHNLQNHTWLNRLYQIREKWCPAFSVDFFSAKMNST